MATSRAAFTTTGTSSVLTPSLVSTLQVKHTDGDTLANALQMGHHVCTPRLSAVTVMRVYFISLIVIPAFRQLWGNSCQTPQYRSPTPRESVC